MAKFKRKYTLGEEIFNSVSHGIGAGLSIAGTVVLIVTATIHTNAWGVVSSCIYGASLIILYTGMSWVIIFAIKPLMEHMPSISGIFLIIGGVFYTVGIIFYAIKKVKYFHSIWHLFTVAGSVFHYFAILLGFFRI